ncbi:MAG: response regulator [Planctomycetes bacterium]|nr:response regulator [Planctomycetota bacterium]
MSSPPNVLFVEDNAGDITLLKSAFDQCWPGVCLHTVSTADKAAAFIDGQGTVTPDLNLILLDLNLPGISGKTVLERMGTSRRAPVVVFSSSCRQQEIDECYRLGASLYVVKPNHWNGYIDLAASFAKLAALSPCC